MKLLNTTKYHSMDKDWIKEQVTIILLDTPQDEQPGVLTEFIAAVCEGMGTAWVEENLKKTVVINVELFIPKSTSRQQVEDKFYEWTTSNSWGYTGYINEK